MTRMPAASPPLPADVVEAAESGNLVLAIKLLREQTNVGLKEAKDRIDEHVRGSRAASTLDPADPEGLPASVLAAMQLGDRIGAIRLLREQTGLGLKEARDAIEASAPRSTMSSPGEVPRSRSRVWWLVVVAIMTALLAYAAFRGGV